MSAPNPDKDRRSPWRRLKDWVDDNEHPPSTWVLIAAGYVFVVALAMFLCAIWTWVPGLRGRFGATGGVLVGVTIVLGTIGGIWRDADKQSKKRGRRL